MPTFPGRLVGLLNTFPGRHGSVRRLGFARSRAGGWIVPCPPCGLQHLAPRYRDWYRNAKKTKNCRTIGLATSKTSSESIVERFITFSMMFQKFLNLKILYFFIIFKKS